MPSPFVWLKKRTGAIWAAIIRQIFNLGANMSGVVPPEPKRPKERTLAEFFVTNGRLLPAEELLLEMCAKGEPAVVEIARPETMTEKNRIRSFSQKDHAGRPGSGRLSCGGPTAEGSCVRH
jgi:hypothetical protein